MKAEAPWSAILRTSRVFKQPENLIFTKEPRERTDNNIMLVPSQHMWGTIKSEKDKHEI